MFSLRMEYSLLWFKIKKQSGINDKLIIVTINRYFKVKNCDEKEKKNCN